LGKFRSESGLTLVEVMIVLVLIGLAAALVLPRGLKEASYGAALNSEAQKLAGVIREARQESITKGDSYSVRLDDSSNSYTLVSTGENFEIDSRIIISNISLSNLGAPKEIVFDQRGATLQTGTIELQDRSDSARKKIIQIYGQGTVDIQ